VTVNAALAAAFVVAAWRHLYQEAERPLRYITFADLRPRVDPPLPGERLGAYITMLRYTVRPGSAGSFWALCRRVTDQVAEGMRRGDRFSAVRLGPAMMRATLAQDRQRMATVAVSYGGPLTLAETDGKIEIRGLHGFVSNLGLGPEYTAQVKLFRSRLLMDIVYLDGDMDATMAGVIADEIVDLLRVGPEG
jgi:hypothetical protein